MKRSWLIGAALVFSLTAVGCSDDDDGEDPKTDGGGTPTDGGGIKTDGGGVVTPMDGGGIDGGLKDGGPTDAGDAGDAR